MQQLLFIHRTILDLNIDTFHQKPWNHPGIDITDFFNFGFHEETWKHYCNTLEQYRDQSVVARINQVYGAGSGQRIVSPETVGGELAQIGQGGGVSSNFNDAMRGEGRLDIPKDRAIQVDGGIGERLPSMDVRRPQNCDSDVVIQIPVLDNMDCSFTSSKQVIGHSDNSKLSISESGGSGGLDVTQNAVAVMKVSHHPPVTALHATDEKNNVETIWCQNVIPKFYGTSIEAALHGKRLLKLLSYGENYVMNAPNYLIRIFPVQSADLGGNVTIRCEESGLAAELCYKGSSFLGFKGNNRSIKGKILESLTSKKLYDIDGNWDRTVQIKDVKDGKSKIVFDAKKTISNLKTPTVMDLKPVRPSTRSGGYNQQSYCPRGPSGQPQWGSHGHATTHGTGYDNQQRVVMYPSQNTQYGNKTWWLPFMLCYSVKQIQFLVGPKTWSYADNTSPE